MIDAGVYPGLEPRLVLPQAVDGPMSLAAEIDAGTYRHPEGVDVLGELALSGLRGRGGAGFSAHIKWQGVAMASGAKVVVANGEEGEPSSFKDRWLLTHRPHLVLDGLLLAARVCGAQRAIVYLSHPETQAAVELALRELRDAGMLNTGPAPEIFMVEPTYVAGEETSVCRAINGGPALPLSKPPRPFERGVADLPTLVSNVETLAHAAWIARHGGQRYREQGTADSPGTALVTLAGACRKPGVYEIPFGVSVGNLFETVGGGFVSRPRGFALGGWFGGMTGPGGSAISCEFGACREAESGWGCGAITVLGEHDDPVAFAAKVSSWYVGESAQQCGVCIKGTHAIAKTIQTFNQHGASDADRENLIRWGKILPGKGACAFLDGAAALGRSLVAHFPDEVAAGVLREKTREEHA